MIMAEAKGSFPMTKSRVSEQTSAPASTGFGDSLSATLKTLAAMGGIGWVIFWLIGDAYANQVMQNFLISPNMLNRSEQSVMLNGVEVFNQWLVLAAINIMVAVAAAALVAVLIWPMMHRNSTLRKSRAALGVLAVLVVLGSLFFSARVIADTVADRTIATFRSAAKACAPDRCPVYKAGPLTVTGILITSDQDRMLIWNGRRVVAVAISQLTEVDEVPDAPAQASHPQVTATPVAQADPSGTQSSADAAPSPAIIEPERMPVSVPALVPNTPKLNAIIIRKAAMSPIQPGPIRQFVVPKQ